MDKTYDTGLKGKLVQLDAYKLEQSSNIRYNGLWVTKCRLGVKMKEMFGYAELPVLMPGTRDVVLIKNLAHNQHRGGGKDTLWRSCGSACITRESATTVMTAGGGDP